MTTLAPAAVVATTPEVVGKAVYLEALPVLDAEGKPVLPWYGIKDSVKQLIIMPGGKDTTGRIVLPAIYSRVVSKTYPKAQWRISFIEGCPPKEEFVLRGEPNYRGLALEAPTYPELLSMPDEIRKSFLTNGIENELFGELMYEQSDYDSETGNYKTKTIHSWRVDRKFAVEITDKDLADVYSHKTPQAVVRRITKVRVSLGLPEKLF